MSYHFIKSNSLGDNVIVTVFKVAVTCFRFRHSADSDAVTIANGVNYNEYNGI